MVASRPDPETSALPLDTLGRPLRDLRISVTDRCNFRCTYCMPREIYGQSFEFLPQRELLTFEEIERLTRVFVSLGVTKVRLTGGEPLLRKDLEDLLAMLAAIDGVDDLTLTTNGSLLAKKAQVLADAGLKRITVSLDSLDDEVFGRLNDAEFPVARVLEGIEAAAAAGLSPIKINMVVRRGENEQSIVPMARFARERGYILRFIEYMDVGQTNGWQLGEVVPAAEIVERVGSEMPLETVAATYPGEVASRWRFSDGSGEIGVISSVTEPFCRTCTRARLTAEGQLFTCLFGFRATDMRAVLRDGVTDDELADRVATIWRGRGDRYSELRSAATSDLPRVEMSHIGG